MQTYLQLRWISPVLLHYFSYGHIVREDHNIVVPLSTCQLTLLTCVCLCDKVTERITLMKDQHHEYRDLFSSSLPNHCETMSQWFGNV